MTITHAISTERLVNVLQSIALKQQTGCLSVECVYKQGHTQREKGNIFFERGDTVYALTGQASGETALSRMLNWKQFLYVFTEGVRYTPGRQIAGAMAPRTLDILRLSSIKVAENRQTPPIGIPAIPRSVRQTAQRQLPAEMVETHILPSLNQMGVTSVFRALPLATSPAILHRLERRERVVLLLMNGRRTVRDVAALIHHDEVEIARTLVHLLKRGYIEYVGAE